MNNKTIFPLETFDREEIHWEDFLYEQTPVELHEDEEGREMYFKREDYFAPIGYYGFNGSKARQGLYLISNAFKEGGYNEVVCGMALPSPTHYHIPSMAKHYGMKAINVIGQSRLEKAVKEREMVAAGSYLGAEFLKAPCNYNASIQKTAREYCEEHEDALYIEYGITLDHKKHSAKEVWDFHEVGAWQVKNFPQECDRLVISLGSGNSATSVLLGIAKYIDELPNLKYIELIATGPDHLKYVQERLEVISDVSGINMSIFDYGTNSERSGAEEPRISVTFHSTVTDMKLFTYDQKFKDGFGDVDLHGRYESKVMWFLKEAFPEFINRKTCFWIVGSELKKEKLEEVYPDGYTGLPVEVTA